MINIFINFVLYLIKFENQSKAFTQARSIMLSFTVALMDTAIVHTTPTLLQFISKYNTSRRDLDIRSYSTYLRPLGLCEL